jgi:hypothetical protein
LYSRSNANLLIDEGIEIEGLRIYGSPMTPLYGTAFGKSSANDRERHWSTVPDDTHVLVTHGPPFGILDRSPDQAKRMGDPELRNRARELPSLKLHALATCMEQMVLLSGTVLVSPMSR